MASDDRAVPSCLDVQEWCAEGTGAGAHECREQEVQAVRNPGRIPGTRPLQTPTDVVLVNGDVRHDLRTEATGKVVEERRELRSDVVGFGKQVADGQITSGVDLRRSPRVSGGTVDVAGRDVGRQPGEVGDDVTHSPAPTGGDRIRRDKVIVERGLANKV